jgi:hypothetical protein
MNCKRIFWRCFFSSFIALLSGCASVPGPQVDEQVAPLVVQHELEKDELLNVSIKVFAPGALPEDEDERRGLSMEIRQAEARYIPIHLKYTMQRSGYWDTVRVVPDDDVGAELLLRGEIEYSDGESLAVNIEAVDASNRVWFNKTYTETALVHEHLRTEPEKEDVFQDLFYTIANDLAEYRNQLSPQQILEIKQIAELRYDADMAPDVFGNYLTVDDSGHRKILRLPSEDDPMFARLKKIRARDAMLIDTINGYYDVYYHDLWDAYANWRKFRTEELLTFRDLERQATIRKTLGIAALVGAIALTAVTGVDLTALSSIMLAGGSYAVYSGFGMSKETQINKDAIEELGASFGSEAEPLVIEVDGEVIRLTGSAEQQYAQWRQLLKQIYFTELGLPDEQVPAFYSSTDSASE